MAGPILKSRKETQDEYLKPSWYYLFIFSLFYDTKAIQRRLIWWQMNDELEGTGRGLILRYYPGIRLEGFRKISVSVADLRAEILSRDLPKTKQKCVPLNHYVWSSWCW
jgi:hypothetical protein